MTSGKAVRLNKTQHENLKKYKELLNKKNKKNKISLADLTNNILEDYFKGMLLTNDYITVKNELYFNYRQLLQEKEVTATRNKRFKDIEYLFIIRQIPNNLDTFNYEYNSYCYNDIKGFHKGVYIYTPIGLDSWSYDGYIRNEDIILVFEYDENENNLTVGVIDEDNITLYFTPREQIIFFKLHKEHEEFKKQVIKRGKDSTVVSIDVELLINSFNVIVSHSQLKEMEQNQLVAEAVEKYVNNKIDNIKGLNELNGIRMLDIIKGISEDNQELEKELKQYRFLFDDIDGKIKKIADIENFTEDDFKELLGD